MHERFASWLERRAAVNPAKFEESVGYHLERAYRYRIELGADRDAVQDLAGRATGHLTAAGWRAYRRGDLSATVGLPSRALDLTPVETEANVDLLNTIGTTLGPLGQLERQRRVLDETVGRARRLGYRAGEWQARLDGAPTDAWQHAATCQGRREHVRVPADPYFGPVTGTSSSSRTHVLDSRAMHGK